MTERIGMTNRAQKLLREARSFIDSGEEANWAAAERMWQANKEEGLTQREIAETVGKSHVSVGKWIGVWDRFGKGTYQDSRPSFTDALYEVWGTTPADREDKAANAVARQRPEKIVDAITKAPPEQRAAIMRGIAQEPALHHEAGRALGKASQQWVDKSRTENDERQPDAGWLHGVTKLEVAESALRAALDSFRRSELDASATTLIRDPLDRITSLLDWINSYVASGDRSFERELDALLAGDDS